MTDRKFIAPTEDEIKSRIDMYNNAEELGIDLMSFDDSEDNEFVRKDIRTAIVFIGQGKTVPSDVRERLLKRKEQSANHKKASNA